MKLPTPSDITHAVNTDVCELQRTPDQFDGKLVRVRGSFTHFVEGMVLFLPACSRSPVCLAFDSMRQITPPEILRRWMRGDTEIRAFGEFQSDGSCVYGTGTHWLVVFHLEPM